MDIRQIFQLDQTLQLRKWWFSSGCLFALGVIFFSLSSITPKADIRNFDKYLHIASYLLLMSWWLQLYQHRTAKILLAILFITMGAGIEFAQSFHPLRYFDVKDMVANAIGVLSACILAYFIKQNFLHVIEKKLLPTRLAFTFVSTGASKDSKKEITTGLAYTCASKIK